MSVNTPAEPRKTALHDQHVALGARLVAFGGFLLPLQYAGILAEHQATRTAATVFDTCHMGEFKVSGSTAVADLERLVSCPVASLPVGHCRYGLLCHARGGVIDDLVLYRLAADDFMLVVNAATQTYDFAWLVAHTSAGTRAANLSDDTGKIDLQGPGAPAILQRLLAAPLAGFRYYTFRRLAYRGGSLLVSRTGYTGEIGFEVYGTPDQVRQFWRDCLAAGAQPAGLGARDTLRLEAGLPLYGHELSVDRNAADTGFSRAIATDKDFIGAAAVRDPARPRQALVALEFADRRAARAGDGIRAAGAAVGVVTSGSFAPSLGHAVALGYVAAAAAAPGTLVEVTTARTALPGRVVARPCYRQGSARRPIEEFLH